MCSKALFCMICPRPVSGRQPMFKQLVDHCCHVDCTAIMTRLRALHVAELHNTSMICYVCSMCALLKSPKRDPTFLFQRVVVLVLQLAAWLGSVAACRACAYAMLCYAMLCYVKL
eukprot:6221125-Heterocapsa_arctica.AAC.1